MGEPHIRLPQSAAMGLEIDERGQIPMRVEVCVDRAGKPDEVRVIDGTGTDKVDNYVSRQLLAGRYRPLRHEGRRVAFCERATVIVEL
jgi:outer membrane biosynthesis protein TonB